jgi:hypothetical protein
LRNAAILGLGAACCALAVASRGHAQQVGDTVPESVLRGPSYSLDRPPAGAPATARAGDQAFRAYIASLQRALPSHGYRCGPITGQLDPLTEQAILAYQADAHLPRDTHAIGVLKATLDHVTYARPPVFASRAGAAAPASPAPESPPPAPAEQPAAPLPAGIDEATVRLVQQRLKDKGYDLDVTGRLDLYTENAIKVFQAANGLPRDGKIDTYLLDLLKQ